MSYANKVERMEGFALVRALSTTDFPKLSRREWVSSRDPVGVARCGWCGRDHVVEVQHRARLSMMQHSATYEEIPETTLDRRSQRAVPDPSGRTVLVPGPPCEGTWSTPGDGPPPNPTPRERQIAELIGEHVDYVDTDYGGAGFMAGIDLAARKIAEGETDATPVIDAFSRELDSLRAIAGNLARYAGNPRVQEAQARNLAHSIESLEQRIFSARPPALASPSSFDDLADAIEGLGSEPPPDATAG